jgi:nucleoside-diphosphate-sugar epimerase
VKIAVTGGAGHLGTLLLRRLYLERRVESVVSLDLQAPLLTSRKLRWARVDVRDPQIGTHLSGCDAIIHLAYLVSGYYRRELADAVNIEGSKNVFTQAANAGVRHLVFCSSIAAYGSIPGHPVPLVEDSPRRYQDEFAYAATKFRVEEWLDDFERARPELAVTRIRPAILVGSRMPNFLGDLLRIRVLPDSGAPLPLVWDEDVVDALMLILINRAPGAFNLAADAPTPTRQLAPAVRMRRIGTPPNLLAQPLAQLSRLGAALGVGYSFDAAWLTCARVPLIASSDRARRVLGWKPRYSTCHDVLIAYGDRVPHRTDRRLRWFFRAVTLSSRTQPKSLELAGMRAVILLMLSGPGGGDFTIRVDDGRLGVRPGLDRSADAVIGLPATVLFRLLCGQASWSQEELAGRIRTEGLPHASMVVAGIITNFRAQLLRPGPPGWLPRVLERWMAQKANERKGGL